jgi:hypothetical protein
MPGPHCAGSTLSPGRLQPGEAQLPLPFAIGPPGEARAGCRRRPPPLAPMSSSGFGNGHGGQECLVKCSSADSSESKRCPPPLPSQGHLLQLRRAVASPGPGGPMPLKFQGGGVGAGTTGRSQELRAWPQRGQRCFPVQPLCPPTLVAGGLGSCGLGLFTRQVTSGCPPSLLHGQLTTQPTPCHTRTDFPGPMQTAGRKLRHREGADKVRLVQGCVQNTCCSQRLPPSLASPGHRSHLRPRRPLVSLRPWAPLPLFPSYRIRGPPQRREPHFTTVRLQRPYSQMRSDSQVPGDTDYFFGGGDAHFCTFKLCPRITDFPSPAECWAILTKFSTCDIFKRVTS